MAARATEEPAFCDQGCLVTTPHQALARALGRGSVRGIQWGTGQHGATAFGEIDVPGLPGIF